MDLNNLEIFVCVVESGSVTKAAQRLGMAKSKVSRKLSQFEQQQGAPLLLRTTRSMQFTDIGRTLYQRSQPLIAELRALEDSIHRAQNQAQGVLRVQVPTDFFPNQFTDICAEFLAEFPAIALHLEQFVGEYPFDDDSNRDIAFALHQGPLPDSDLNVRELMSLPLSVYGATHKYTADELSINSLKEQNCLLLQGETSWFFRTKNQLRAERIKGRFKVPNQRMLIDACVSGLGIARLADIDVESQLRTGALVRLKTTDTLEAQTLSLLFRKKYLPVRAKVFIDFFQSHIGRLSSRI